MLGVIKFGLYIGGLGAISSVIGAFIGNIFNIKSKEMISFLYQITAGIMTGIVCFEMLPESFQMANVIYSVIGILIGISLIFFLDIIIQRNNKKKDINRIIGLIVILSMAFHNIIEGLAIGSSFVYSFTLGTTVLIGMFLHDIPEGMIVGITSKVEGKKLKTILLESIIVGACSGFGTYIGNIIGKINEKYIAISLSISAGAMLYLVSCELIPSSNEICKSKKIYITFIFGIIIGALISKI